MAEKPYALFTLAGAIYGEFLTRHWLPSLLENVDLSKIDVIVLDHGLASEHRQLVESHGIICHSMSHTGIAIGNMRYKEMASVLQKHHYDQVVLMDAGDIIFQGDFSTVFEENKNSFRAPCEDVDAAVHEWIMKGTDFLPGKWREITDLLRGKRCVNTSAVFAPAEKYIYLSEYLEKCCKSYDEFGTDQAVLNHLLYSEGFVQLPSKYNFVLCTTRERYTIRRGVFFDSAGEAIPVVHNAGGQEKNRVIRNFGYGQNYNKRKMFRALIGRVLQNIAAWYWGR